MKEVKHWKRLHKEVEESLSLVISKIQLVKILSCPLLRRMLNQPESFALLKFPPYSKNENNWWAFSPNAHTKNILCYSSPSPLWHVFIYFKAELPASNDESISCIHKSWSGNKWQFSVCPPPVQLPFLSYRIATEEPRKKQKSILNHKDIFLKTKVCKLISESPQNILQWKKKRMIFFQAPKTCKTIDLFSFVFFVVFFIVLFSLALE